MTECPLLSASQPKPTLRDERKREQPIGRSLPFRSGETYQICARFSGGMYIALSGVIPNASYQA
jgi:hypothetical protein